MGEAAESGLHRGAPARRFGADLRRQIRDAQVLAVCAVAARLASVLGALGATVEAAKVVVNAEARPLAAGRSAFLLFRFLLPGIHRRAVLSMRRPGDQRQEKPFSSAAPPHARSPR